ncbi:MAG: molybdopterin-dependent oxidoreductase [Treponema sp.]|jgi:CO/xanthine dehydrogenase Mo-binding subunit|nr:molybdopterin-dependent oxidoreductase [Treponema sp.]
MDAPCYLEDLYPQQFLHAVTIRSPVSKGYLIFIDYPKLPANYTLITARNIPGKNRLFDTNIPILADRQLSYFGEPVALLLGQDKTKLEEYAAKINVVVDTEEPVFSFDEKNTNIFASREIKKGDPQSAFDNAHTIVRGSYNTGIQEHWYAEPTGAVTWYEQNTAEETGNTKAKKNEKILIVRTATQWPHHVKNSVAIALGIDHSALMVSPTSISLHMDGKLTYPSLIACHAALGTFITKRPVRFILNRGEDFLFSPKRFKTRVNISSALDERGRVTATEIDLFVNLGSHAVNANEILDQTCLGSLGFYNFDNISLTASAKGTNIPPQGPFSGFGIAHGLFAMERHVSHIADELMLDPAQWRKNIKKSGIPGEIQTDELINTAAAMSGYYRKWASYELLRQSRKGKTQEKGENLRGVGIAIGYQVNGLLYSGSGSYSVEITLTKEGSLEIKTGMICSDEDFISVWSMIASEILSIEPEMVRIITANAPDAGPACSSRNITAITKLVEKCCLAIRKQKTRDPLPITVRRSAKPQSGALWDGRKVTDISGFSKPSRAAAVVEVTIDPVESNPEIRGIWLAIDGGKIISMEKAKRSLSCSVIQALGWSFTENIDYVNGILPVNQYDNYAIPDPAGIPPVEINFLGNSTGEPKGIGELPFTCIPAAYLQAVSQAMDHCFNSIPIRKDQIWEASRHKKDSEQ